MAETPPASNPTPEPEPVVYLQPGDVFVMGDRLDLTAPYSTFDRTGKAWIYASDRAGPFPMGCQLRDSQTREMERAGQITHTNGIVGPYHDNEVLADYSDDSWTFQTPSYHDKTVRYVDYQGRHSLTPVNQYPYTRVWLKHAATFAHEIDTLFSENSIIYRRESNFQMIPGSAVRDSGVNLRNQNALQYGRAICGFAFSRAKELHDVDPTSERALSHVPLVQPYVEAICLVCNHAHWLRQFLFKHDVIPWRNALDEVLTRPNSGGRYKRVPLIDKTSEPWQPSTENFTTFTGSNLNRWYEQQMINFGKAVDYYDDNYGTRE